MHWSICQIGHILYRLSQNEDDDEAENFLDIWLPKLQMEDNLVGIIIHGKGYGSGPNGPKLKNFVDQYLQYNPNILAYHSAQQKDGGTGAVYIQLKKMICCSFLLLFLF